MGLLNELIRIVEEGYTLERQRVQARLDGQVPELRRKLRDVPASQYYNSQHNNNNDNNDESESSNNSSTILSTRIEKWHVMECWRELLQAMLQYDVFTDYVKSLRRAFLNLRDLYDDDDESESNTAEDPSENSNSSIEDKKGEKRARKNTRNSKDNITYHDILRHYNTLVNLLTQTALNKSKDPSTDCRFVTLLEIMLSYGRKWHPSDEVSRFWVRLMQRIPPNVEPMQFRRMAYRVLVSLAWVPSSKGLLEACSFEGQQWLNVAAAPPVIQEYFSKFRRTPLPRSDCVNQLLDRLKDETDVCVAISSPVPGVGKTTLAALVSSHPSILRVFRVLWISFPSKPSVAVNKTNSSSSKEWNYKAYARYLKQLYQQLDTEMNDTAWPELTWRLEEPALQRLRQQAFMKQAKEQMSQLLLSLNLNVLLILDNVDETSPIEWFRFNERQSVIVTTRNTHLSKADWTVQLDPLSPEEGVELFLDEASLPQNHLLGSTVELWTLVTHNLEHNPLMIRTVARWFYIKQVTTGIVEGLEEIIKELDSLDDSRSNPDSELSISMHNGNNHTNGQKSRRNSLEMDSRKLIANNSLLMDILSILLGPKLVIDGESTTILFVLCWAAMTVVFPEPKIPLDVVLLLWEQLLQVEPLAIDELQSARDGKESKLLTPKEIRKQTWLVAEGLLHMGIINIRNIRGDPWVEPHQDEYAIFAVYMAREMDLNKTYNQVVQDWNRAFVTAYFTRRIQETKEKVSTDRNSWKYAVDKVPEHMFRANTLPMGETILSDENFFRARLETLGWEKAIERHIQDCIQLQQALEGEKRDDTTSESQAEVSPVFANVAALVSVGTTGSLGVVEDSYVVEVSRALYQIGFALADIGHFREAIIHFESARKLLPQSQSLRASILYGEAWGLFSCNEIDKAQKKIKACLKLMDEAEEVHDLRTQAVMLQAEACVGECEYVQAAYLFELVCEQLRESLPSSRIDLGQALYKKGYLHQAMGDLDEAIAAYTESIQWKDELNEISIHKATVYSALGDASLELRKISDSKEYFEKGLNTLDELKHSTRSTKYLLLSAKLKFLRQDFAGSFEAFEHARSLIKASPDLRSDQSAYDLLCIAKAYQGQSNLDRAVAVLEESVTLTGNRLYSLVRSASLLNLGNCLVDSGSADEGLVCLEQALEIRILKLGECAQVLDTLRLIGDVHLTMASYAEAVNIFHKVYEITERIAGDDADKLTSVLAAIGKTLKAQKKYDEANEAFDQCIEMLAAERSLDHEGVATALQQQGEIALDLGNLKVAKENFEEALRIRSMHFDDNLLAETKHYIGVLTRKLGDYKAAETLLTEALETRKRSNKAIITGETLLELGNVYRLQSDYESAISIYEKAQEVLTAPSEVAGSVWLATGHAMLALKRDEEALSSYFQARDIRLECLGKDNVKTGNAHRSLGVIKYILNDTTDALLCLNEYARVCELCSTDSVDLCETVDYVVAIMIMGDIHSAFHRTEQAKNVWTVGAEICADNDEIAKQIPEVNLLLQMRIQMLEAPSSPKPPNSGIIARIQDATGLSAPSGHIAHKEEELDVIRQIVLVDD